jgi:hypothetical protein
MIEICTYLQYVNADTFNAENGCVPGKLLTNGVETNCFHMPVAYADEGTVMNHQAPKHYTFARFLWQHSTKTRVKRRLCLLAAYIIGKAGATITCKWVGGRREGWVVVECRNIGR